MIVGARGPKPQPKKITAEHAQILTAISRGLTNPQIAEDLQYSEYRVAGQLKIIFAVLGVHTRAQAVTAAVQQGIIASREWTLTINAPDEWLTANDRRHRRVQAPIIAAWRRAAYQMAQAARLPKGLTRVRIEPVARFSGRPPVREAPNLAPTVKAAVDGLGPQDRGKTEAGVPWISPGYGLVSDDDDKHVELARTVIGERLPWRPLALGCLVLTIYDLSDALGDGVGAQSDRPTCE